MLNKLLYSLTGKWAEIRIEYGILALAASVAVPLKLFLFYNLIGVTANFFFVWLITAILTYFLFASFRNKWIPAIIYLLLSVLMFCDVTYSSFFNRYLSVNMLGAAGFLGDITASIKEVLKPWFFLILADAILIIAALAVRQRRLGKTAELPQETEAPEAKEEEETAEEEPDSPEVGEDQEIQEIQEIQEAHIIANLEARRAKRQRKKQFMEWASGHKKPIAALLIICLLITGLGLGAASLFGAGGASVIGIAALSFAGFGIHSLKSPFWALAPMTLSASAAAGGIAWINSVGNLGGFFGPSVLGWLADMFNGNYQAGILVLACVQAAAIIVTIFLRPRAGTESV
jgi:MFS family permease